MRLTLILLLILPGILYSQYENYNWVFGNKCRIQFDINSKQPSVINDVYTNVTENTAVISDENGELKFYSTDSRIYNNENKFINKDYKIAGHNSSTQGSIFLRLKSGNYLRIATSRVVEEKAYKPLISYMFSEDGDLISTDTLLQSYSAENICVVRNYKNENHWLILHEKDLSHYKIYQIDENGVDLSSLKINEGIDIESEVSSLGIGYLKSSPDGSMLVSCVFRDDFEDSGFYILRNFDPIKGEIGGLIDTIRVKSAYCAEFSPNSNFLYYQSFTDDDISNSGLFQYNIYTGEKIRLISGIKDIKTLLLAPDNSIYFTIVNASNLGRIRYPNRKGKDCDLVMNELSLKSGKSFLGLPNLCTSDYNDIFIPNVINLCDGSDLLIEPIIRGDIDKYTYSWTGPNGYTSDNLIVYIPNPSSDNSGIYTLTARNKTTDEIKTLDVQVFINEIKPIEIFSLNGFSVCAEKTLITLDREFEKYEWDDGSTRNNRILDSTGTYWVKAIDKYGCEYFAEFYVYFVRPVITGPDVICSGKEIELSLDREFETYEWNNGANTKSIKISKPGIYEVTVTDSNGCEKTVSKIVTSGEYPTSNIIGKKIICNNDPVELSSDREHYKYLWSNGDTTKNTLIDSPGIYYLEVTNEAGCSTIDSVEVEEIETDHILDKYELIYDKLYISDILKDSINFKNISNQTLVLNYDTVIEPGDSANFNIEIKFDSLGVYKDTLVLLITAPCYSQIYIPLEAKVYAKVNLHLNDLYSSVGLSDKNIDISINSRAYLYDDYTISGEIEIPYESYFTNESNDFTFTGPLNPNLQVIKQIPGTVLLSPKLVEEVTFKNIETSHPFVEIELDTGKIIKDRVCINEVRNIKYQPDLKLNIFPNPAKSVINAETNISEGDIQYNLLDINSSVVDSGIKKLNDNTARINTTNIPTGVYQLIIFYHGDSISQKIIIIN